MIEFYSFDTPNGKKVEIFLDLLKIPYNKHVINIMQGLSILDFCQKSSSKNLHILSKTKKPGDQNNEDFKKLNPNQKIPTITDTEPPFQKEPITLWESGLEKHNFPLFFGKSHIKNTGAILIYLAENYDKEKIFFPVDEPSKKYEVLKWLFFQMAGIGPMFFFFFEPNFAFKNLTFFFKPGLVRLDTIGSIAKKMFLWQKKDT